MSDSTPSSNAARRSTSHRAVTRGMEAACGAQGGVTHLAASLPHRNPSHRQPRPHCPSSHLLYPSCPTFPPLHRPGQAHPRSSGTSR
eukprot:363761-Chlamydomonas_euryale.AAC.4